MADIGESWIVQCFIKQIKCVLDLWSLGNLPAKPRALIFFAGGRPDAQAVQRGQEHLLPQRAEMVDRKFDLGKPYDWWFKQGFQRRFSHEPSDTKHWVVIHKFLATESGRLVALVLSFGSISNPCNSLGILGICLVSSCNRKGQKTLARQPTITVGDIHPSISSSTTLASLNKASWHWYCLDAQVTFWIGTCFVTGQSRWLPSLSGSFGAPMNQQKWTICDNKTCGLTQVFNIYTWAVKQNQVFATGLTSWRHSWLGVPTARLITLCYKSAAKNQILSQATPSAATVLLWFSTGSKFPKNHKDYSL